VNYWLRLYTSILNDPKVQRLKAEHFKGWINLLCLAKEQDGILPELPDIAFCLRISETEAQELVSTLQRNGLLDKSGEHFTPHNWESRQYVTDVSTDRVRRFRERRRNGEGNVSEGVSGSVSATAPEQSRAETEQRQRQQQSRNGLAAAAQNEEHKSSFSLANVRRYVDAVKRHATNPGGLARVLWRSGEEDTDIGNRLEREQMRAGALVGPNDDFSDFGMDDYIAHLIERRDITELKKEREGIHDRGGPIDPWERRVCDYLNQHAANEAASIEGGRQ
jgi:hypothetical protein